MCDTVLAMPACAAQGAVLFGKNSDRQRNEAQAVEYLPRADHAPDAQLRCTYLSIAQAPRTHAVLLCRPFWIWGAEMGANEHGVVIGNEGLHARSPAPEQPALTGMDLVRLALERATTAAEAIEVITSLLERHGQGGNCGHITPNFYNNGFMVADPREAFVLETVGREWLVERANAVRTMSNVYSIDRRVERTSAGLGALISNCGWSTEPNPSYAHVIANPNREHIGYAKARRARTSTLLTDRAGQLGIANLMTVLRDHGPFEMQPQWHPCSAATVTVCMHATTEQRPGQTVGSMASELYERDAIHWVTGTSAPCISIYKPVFLDAPPPTSQVPTGRFDPSTLWWRQERLYRAALMRDFGRFLGEIAPERDVLEADFRARVHDVRNGGTPAERERVVAECWRDASELTQRWEARVAAMPLRSTDACEEWSKSSQLAGWDALPGNR